MRIRYIKYSYLLCSNFIFFLISTLIQVAYSQQEKIFIRIELKTYGITEKNRNDFLQDFVSEITQDPRIDLIQNARNPDLNLKCVINYSRPSYLIDLEIKVRKGDKFSDEPLLKYEYRGDLENIFKSSVGQTMINNILSKAYPLIPSPPSKEPSFDDLFLSGIREMTNGNNKLAISIFKNAKNKYPKRTESYIHLGRIYARNGEYKEALKEFNQCIKIDQEAAEAYKDIAEIYLAENNIGKSIEFYEIYLKLKENDRTVKVLVDSIKKWQSLPKIIYKTSPPETVTVEKFYKDNESNKLLTSYKKELKRLKEDSLKYQKEISSRDSLIKTNENRINALSDNLQPPIKLKENRFSALNWISILLIITGVILIGVSIYFMFSTKKEAIIVSDLMYFFGTTKLANNIKFLFHKLVNINSTIAKYKDCKNINSQKYSELISSISMDLKDITKTKSKLIESQILLYSKESREGFDYQRFCDKLITRAKSKNFSLKISEELKQKYPNKKIKINLEVMINYFIVLFEMRNNLYCSKYHNELKKIEVTDIRLKDDYLSIQIKWKPDYNGDIEFPDKHKFWKKFKKQLQKENVKIIIEKDKNLVVVNLPRSK